MKKIIKTEVLIIGGGAGGSAAGIQAARLGAETIIVEETQWLGGMFTAAGVSAFDGNKYALGGGIFGEIRKELEDYYGGFNNTFTGWISHTCFEPKVGKNILHSMVENEQHLRVFFNTQLVKVLKEGNKITGAVFKDNQANEMEIQAEVTIEATEMGDMLALGEIPYDLGRDSKEESGEPDAPDVHDYEMQDMTYCAILKKFKNKAPAINPSPNYDPLKFECSTAVDCSTGDENYLNHKLHDWHSFITYAELPNRKYMLNWPHRANDYPAYREIYENSKSRQQHYQKAKELTLDYVHYIQTKLGHPEWGLAEDEFPTEDNLPLIPYFRESRRIKGIKRMKEEDVIPVENSFRPKPIQDSIAVGDYYLDHHHSKEFNPPGKRLGENYPANAPFQVPFGVLIPEHHDGLIAAEKSISVTHIVNGCTRLQPVVMLIGQAAGITAYLAAKSKIKPRNVKIRDVHNLLIENGCQLLPYRDLWNNMDEFPAVQHLAIMEIFNDSEDFQFNGNEKISKSEKLKISKLPLEREKIQRVLEYSDRKSRSEIYLSVYEIIKNS
jgi:hypothetical protein